MNDIAASETLAGRQSEPDVSENCPLTSADLCYFAISATLIPVSLIWDFSWESSIGVDRFWSPPHLATYVGVWLNGLLAFGLLFRFSFSKTHSASGVRLAGLYAPSGAWVILWGVMLVQATLLLDNWWQKTYGLGAGLWPPPQILKTIGFFSILIGGSLLRSAARSGDHASDLFLSWYGGLLLTLAAVVLTMTNLTNRQHTAFFYFASCVVYPVILTGIGVVSYNRWGCTRAALAYTIVVCAMVWLLPLFPAHPLTPPVHNHLDRMMPPQFPLMLLAPALGMDFLRARWNHRPGAVRVALLGITFVSIFVSLQWFFARFLLSPGADNWFFAGGGAHWPYFLKIDQARTMFWGGENDSFSGRALLLASVLSMASAWAGLVMAKILKNVRR